MSHHTRFIADRWTLALRVSLLCLISFNFTQTVSAQVGDLIWQDNFDTLNNDIWTVDVGDGCDQGLCGWGNAELQSYEAANVSITAITSGQPSPGQSSNHALQLQARHPNGGQITSGKVLSDRKLAVRYGMIEFRLQVPDLDTGYWPAVWMLGTSTLPWPNKGEIDMMEMGHRQAGRLEWYAFNDDPSDDSRVDAPPINHFTGANLIKYDAAACVPGNETCAASSAWQTDNAHVSATPLSNRFVIYRTYWTPDSIRFTVEDNGIEYDLYDTPQPVDADGPFREPFFLLMNLAIGGNFTDALNASQITAPDNGNMLVDYIRVYQYNGFGEVLVGDQTSPETGTFGVFTDTTPTTNKLEAGVSSSIFLWDPTSSDGATLPYEGDNVIAWSYDGANTWFGGGVQSNQARNLTNFADGELTFNIQIPADVSFRIGVTDTYSNENWVTFPALETKYGLTRDGSWGQVSIPMADLRGDLIAIQSLQYLFAISSDASNLPDGPFEYAIDNIFYTGGGSAPLDSDGDGVVDADDACPNTPTGATVDNNGCEVIIIAPETKRIQAQDYINYSDSTLGNIGGEARTDDVDIEITGDNSGAYNVGWTATGEWLEYNVQLGAGDYDLLARVATQQSSGPALSVSLNGSSIGAINVDYTGGWQTYETLDLGLVSISLAGSYTVRVDITGGGLNLNWLEFTLREQQAVDSDGDGILDSIDLCANTPNGVAVDASGCPISQSNPFGANKLNNTTLEFYVATSGWADVHYSKNGGAQQNHRMTQANDRNTFQVHNLVDNDQLTYWFTYLDPSSNQVVDTAAATYTHNTNNPIDTNIALQQPATASSALQSASLAFDGDLATRWESSHSVDPTWLSVDLGQTFNLSAVSIDWEAANAASYSVQGSLDGSNWTTLFSLSNGAFGARTDTRTVAGLARYVRMLGQTRSQGNDWGYSIFEMQVMGSPANSAADSDGDGVADSQDNCPNTPPTTQVDVIGCPIPTSTGDITPLFNANTALEPDTQYDRGDALVTRFSDRPRTRHAREDQYQSYDHYIKFYFEHRASNIEIIDYVAKGGDSIVMNVRTLWPLNDSEAENRWWYLGRNTVAEYHGGMGMEFVGFDGTYWNYTKSDNLNRQYNREIQLGDRLEFEISQFSRGDIPRGQANYYGTTYLYIVGKGVVPWYTENAGEFVQGAADFQEDSREIPESYWLGGNTTIHYQYTDEPNDHFMQMATNLGYLNGQKFLEGRRLIHSSFIDGTHDEDPENGVLSEVVNLVGSQAYINQRCSGCHERNGSAPVANNNELLDRWVFKVAGADGQPHPEFGRVLQPKQVNGGGEGDVSIAFWSELADGLRAPTYQFSNGAPQRFSARIAPRLVGLGLLEAIPETTILAQEDPNDIDGDGISGRANRIIDPANPQLTRLGRFGWKAATTSLHHQVSAALNTDMGVRTQLLPNLDCGAAQSGCNNNSPILAEQHVDKMVTYLTGLGVRPQRGWESGNEDQTIVNGKSLFTQSGCAGCHTPSLQTSEFHPLAEARDQVIHPYSDLLLHDMGDGLADNLGEGDASGREWRTTPLWGLGLAACVTGGVSNVTGLEGGEVCTPHHAYLHDGRARSIEEAILWHDGEARNAKLNYQGLSQSDKNAMLRFLESL
ncbi:di-heme oxidoredictase family protein [Arenicella xantha]|uniref:CxxC motif-containing protein (DUF1111 family) n=1 Tax=Arenicella xantha TaxID=644221 RepID=A0A395JIG8_9GAMM|nr:di-heme oxidoredictase family protein [Arenicella xantha]RBP48737.1 CxxC motif-containing protein (DUF1111 family) [Arenicella xantha]